MFLLLLNGNPNTGAMMKLPTLFGKIPKHQRFNYGPRYYDPVKDEREARHKAQKLTEDEVKFHAKWNGQINIITTFEEAISIMGVTLR